MAIVNAIFSNRWARSEFIVQSASSLEIDSNLFSEFKGTKYYVQAFSESNNLYKSFEMIASREGAGVSDSLFAKIGDTIDLEFNFNLSGPSAILTATNNESFPVSIVLTKLN
jgi:hypothetical protein